MNKPINHILTKELSRKEFLSTIMLGVASLVGLSTLHRLINGKSIGRQNQETGYGASPYGR